MTSQRLRFFLVEDEPLIAMIIEDYLGDLGYHLVFQADNIKDALEFATTANDLDGAILDVNVRGETSHAVAAALKDRGIPFCLLTGDRAPSDPLFAGAPVLAKPFDLLTMERTLGMLVAPAPRGLPIAGGDRTDT